jgi:hypothetical protein
MTDDERDVERLLVVLGLSTRATESRARQQARWLTEEGWRTQRRPIERDAMRVYERCGGACVTCGATYPLHVDHIVRWLSAGPRERISR